MDEDEDEDDDEDDAIRAGGAEDADDVASKFCTTPDADVAFTMIDFSSASVTTLLID